MASFDQNSKVAGHVHLFGHNMKFENVEVGSFESNYHERPFLEAWYSTLDPNAGNDHILLTTKVSREHELHVSLKLCVHVSLKLCVHERMTTNFVFISLIKT